MTDNLFALAAEFVNDTSQHVFLTGKAGTGKTTFLREIKQNTHKNAVVAAPTGVAAINAGGVTLHSLFQLPFSPFLPQENAGADISHFRKEKINLLRKIDLLIIDEVSMLRADVLDAIDAVLRGIRRTTTAFGGVQMLYIGDMFQLPPVVKDEELEILKHAYPSPFFFHSRALRKCPPVYIELKHVYRQQDSLFIDLLNRVRNNVMQPTDLELLNSHYVPDFTPPPDKKFITLTTHNYQADNINSDKLNALPFQTFEYKGIIEGDFPEYLLPAEMNLHLKRQAQIMFVKNDSSQRKQYYNGKIGIITKISEDEIYVLCEGEDVEIQLHRETWENNRYVLNRQTGLLEEEALGSFTQYPLRLAWAITVHKSQGLTFNNVILDISRAFAAGQAYVALSRCTALEGIVFQSPVSYSAIKTDKYALALSAKERSKDELEKALAEQKQLFWTEKLKSCFSLKNLYSIFYEFEKSLKEKDSEEFDSAKLLLNSFRKFAKDHEKTVVTFQNQLQKIINAQPCAEKNSNDRATDTSEADYALIKERCQKAVEYFYPLYINNLLLPLRENINNFYGVKKSKTYYKNLLSIEQDLTLFIEELKSVEFYGEKLIDTRYLKIPQNTVFQPVKTRKSKKGDSAKVSLEMYKSGKTIDEIAKERNITEGTVFGHLSDYILKGQISVFELVDKEKVEAIMPLVDTQTKAITPVREQLGDNYTYSEIRAVIKHCLWLENREKQLAISS
ncbi:MAG: helix-turn-helix domain-containing protein [Prevotellaceae bacterium]|jgi:hypothetical protein|nr:helix-turn-helix domain-containing protein [Prevotellaceae bacterium]